MTNVQMIDDRFVLEARLNHGRFGTVYRALDSSESFGRRDRVVSLWLLPEEFSRNRPAMELFERDFDRVRDFVHPAVARVYELARDGDRYFVTSELLDGEPLRNVLDHLRPERLDLDEADEIVERLGDALARAHDAGIVHADVRAENVLVTTDHRVSLLNLMTTALLRSTPLANGATGDVRDLAALAHELYTGRRPGADGRRRVRGVPRRRLRAIENALRRPRSIRAFLTDAGLEAPPAPYAAEPRPAGAPRREREQERPRVWRTVFAAAAVAAVGLGFYTGGALDLLETISLDQWAATQRSPDPAAAAATGTLERQPSGLVANRETSFGSARTGDAVNARSSDARPDDPIPTPADSASAAGAPTAPAEESPTPTPVEAGGSGAEPTLLPEEDAASAADGERIAAAASAPGTSVSTLEAAARLPVRDPSTSAAGTASEAREAAPPAGRDAARPGFSLSTSAITAYEGQAVVEIELVRDSPNGPSEVIWWTDDGTAVAGDDYASFGRRLETFAPGETTRSVQIPITSDSRPEPDEHFYVHLDAGRDVPTRLKDATITLIDDDR